MDPIHQSHLSALCEERKRNSEKDEELIHVRVQERNSRPSSIGAVMRVRLETRFYVSSLENKIGVEIGGGLQFLPFFIEPVLYGPFF
jgi:hypothetical protein